MKHILHKLLAVTMAVMMLFSALPTSALAQITVSNTLRIGATGYSITGGNQVEVGKSLALTGESGSNHSWNSSDPEVASVVKNDKNGRKATVSGLKEGSVTITHTYYTNNNKKTETIEITVVAAKATISFDRNGGTGTAPNPISATESGADITLPGADQMWRSDYTFMGWAESATDVSTYYMPGDKYTVTESKTLYAVWGITVSFDANGGSGSVDPIVVPSAGTIITLPSGEGLSNGSATFMGWGAHSNVGHVNAYNYINNFEKALNDTTIYGAGAQVEIQEARTFYAVWAKSSDATYYIRLNGTIPREPGSFDGSNYSSGMSGTIEYDTFYFNASGVDSRLGAVPDAGTLYTTCEAAANSITFSDGTTYQSCKDANEFASKYYVLWYVIKNDNGMHVDGVLLKKTLYNVNYDSNCAIYTGSVPIGKQYSAGTTVTVTTNTLGRVGYVFKGWSTDSKATKPEYIANNTFDMPSHDVTLYAVWEPSNATKFTVEHYLGDSTEPVDTEEKFWRTGATLYPEQYAKSFTGYKYDHGDPASALVAPDGSTVLKLYYVKDENQTHSVSYQVEYYKDNVLVNADTVVKSSNGWIGDETAIDVVATDINTTDKYEGYVFVSTDPAEIPTRYTVAAGEATGAVHVIKVFYVTEIYYYTIEHYRQQLNAEESKAEYACVLTEENVELIPGTTVADVKATHDKSADITMVDKHISGDGTYSYTLDHAELEDSHVVVDGNTIKLYYNRTVARSDFSDGIAVTAWDTSSDSENEIRQGRITIVTHYVGGSHNSTVSTGTLKFRWQQYNCVDVDVANSSDEYIINTVVAEQAQGKSGYKPISVVDNSATIDNVGGGSTVHIYLTPRYTVKYYQDGAEYKADPDTYTIPVGNVTGEGNTATNASADNTSFIAEALPTAAEEGYKVTGWENGEDGATIKAVAEGTTVAIAEVKSSDNGDRVIDLYCKTEAKENTPYKVEFYLQNADGTYPATASVTDDTRKGTTGGTATVKETDKADREGGKYVYDAENEGNFESDTIKGDGSTTLKLYFKLNQANYVIHHVEKGNEANVLADDTTGTAKVGDTITVVDEAVEIAGFTYDSNTGDITIVAGENKATIYYRRNNYPVKYVYVNAPEEAGNPPAEKTHAYKANVQVAGTVTIPGYTFDGWNTEDVEVVDGAFTMPAKPVTLTGTFTPNTNISYKVEYRANSVDGLKLLADKNVENQTMGSLVTETAEEIAGYTVDQNQKNLKLEAENNVIVFIYKPNMNTRYTVEYYYQEDGAYPETANVSAKHEGTTGETVSITDADKADREYNGKKYTYDENAGNVESDTLAGDGKLVLKVYFKQQFTVRYEPGTHGTFEVESTEGLDYGAETPKAPEATGETGYTFTGWNPEVAGTVTEDAVYVAQWIANTNTPYTVEYYYQENGVYPESASDSDEREGTTGETVSITDADKADREYNGKKYTYDESAGNVESDTLAGDGSTTLKVYLKQQFTVRYEPGTHGTFEAQSTEGLDYGAETPKAPATPGEAGYTFTGWNPEVAGTVTEDAVYVAQWSANTDTAYTVEYYYQENGVYPESASDSDGREGTTDAIVSVTEDDKTPQRTGYVEDEAAEGKKYEGTVTGDGKLVLKVYFKQQFTVRYEPGTHGTFEMESTEGLDYGAETPKAPATPGEAGYTFTGWNPAVAGTVTEDAVYVAQWIANTNTPYTVEYYYQENGVYPESASDSDGREGTTDATVSVTEDDKTPQRTGYVEDEAAEGKKYEGTVTGDGKLVLKVYFKQQFTVRYEPGTHGTFEVESTEGLDYGAETPEAPATPGEAGYTFTGWNPAVAGTVTEDATYVAQWSANTDTAYTVEYYLQRLENKDVYEHQPNKDEVKYGQTDTAASVTAEDVKEFAGFTYDADNVNNVSEGIIAGNGSLKLKLYYTRNSYDYVIHHVDKDDVEKVLASDTTGSALFGAEIDVAAAQTTITGYKYDSADKKTLTIGIEDNAATLYYVRDDAQKHSVKAQVEYYYADTLEDAKAKATADATDEVNFAEGWIGADTVVTVAPNTTDKFVGYKHHETEGELSYTVAAGQETDEELHVVKVYYVKDDDQTQPTKYTVQHVVAGESEPRDTKSYAGTDWINEENPTVEIVEGSLEPNSYTGYKYAGMTPEVEVGDRVADEAVITLRYEADYDQTQPTKYTVRYTIEGAWQENDNVVVTGEAWINDDPAQIAIAEGGIPAPENKYTGYKLDPANAEYPEAGALVDSGSEYTVNYVKRTDLTYTVNYYWNGTEIEVHNPDTITGQTFQETITVNPIEIEGYTPVSDKGQEILIEAENNVVNFYYYKDVTLTANSNSATYNGEEQQVSGFTVEGEREESEADFSAIEVGAKGTTITTEDNRYLAEFADGTVGTIDGTQKYIVAEAIDGELEIKKRPVTITVKSAEYDYDGEEKTVAEVPDDEEYVIQNAMEGADSGLLSGHTESLNVVYGTDAAESKSLIGVYEAFVLGAVVITKDADGSDVTANYEIIVSAGELTIKADEEAAILSKTHVEDKAYGINEVVTFTIAVQNAYNSVKTITLEELPNVTLAQTEFVDVQPGESVSTTATYTITEQDIINGSFTNEVTARFSDEAETYTATDAVSTVPMEGKLEKTKVTLGVKADGGYTQKASYAPGDEIWYRITVTNAGNVTYRNVKVIDELTGLDETIGVLEPGRSASFDTSYTVTSGDVLTGTIENYAAVDGGATPTPAPSNPATPVPTATPNPDPTPDTTDKVDDLNATLTVTKTSNLNGAAAKLGDTIEYEISVTNEGNVPYTNVTVADELSGAKITEGAGYEIVDGKAVIAELGVGETAHVYAEYTVTEADILAGKVENIATAQADPIVDPKNPETPIIPQGSARVEDPTEELNAALTVTKTSSLNGAKAKLGDTIHYGIQVTNSGNVTLENVVVEDHLANARITSGQDYSIEGGKAVIERLGVNRSVMVYAEYTVTEADILAGRIENIATAQADNPKDPDSSDRPSGEGRVTDETEDLNAALAVDKRTANPKEGGYAEGDTIEYEIVVTNAGNVPFTNVTITDELAGVRITEGEGYAVVGGKAVIELLNVNASVTIMAEYTVTLEDIRNGKVLNRATAVADPIPDPKNPDNPKTPRGEDEEENDTAAIDATLTVTKTSNLNGATAVLGQTIRYTIAVRNAGNVPFTNVVVEDLLTGATIVNGSGYSVNASGRAVIAELDIGEVVNVYAEYTVTEADVLAGWVTNTATAQADPVSDPKNPETPIIPQDSDDVTDEVGDIDARLTVDKVVTNEPANGRSYALGDEITYRITVRNDGNASCKNVVVVDELTGDRWIIDELPIGEARWFDASYVVTEADVLAGHVLNRATAQADPIPDPKNPETPIIPQDSDEVDLPIVNPEPSLFVEKRETSTPANGVSYALGERVTYEITVLNNGNVTVQNITVTDDLTGASWTIDELAVNETSRPFVTEYVVTEADILNGVVVNVATASGTDPDGNEAAVTPGREEVDTDRPNPDLSITKTLTNLPEKGYFTAGETAEFDIVVSNTGNVALSDITVTEELANASFPDGGTATIASLEPNGTAVIQASYTVTAADIGRELVNIVVARSEDPTDPSRIIEESAEEEIPTDDTVEITGIKRWEDVDNAFATRPETITLHLMANGVEIASTEASASSGWAYSFIGLPKHSADGSEIVYSVTEVSVPGYDSIYAEDGYSITNQLQRYTLTIRYWYDEIGGEVAAPTVVNTYYYGESYDVASPNIPGYSVSAARIAGVIEGNVEYDVIYTRNSYRLTVRYVFRDGTTAAPTYERTLNYGDAYSATSPALGGYTVSRRVVSGTMPARNLVYTVIYVSDTVEVVIDEYGVPLGIGNVEMNVGDCFE